MGHQSGRSGRGGCGFRINFHTKKSASKPSKEPEKKNLEDFTYILGSAKQAADYDKTTDFIINYIKIELDDGRNIASSLKSLELMEDADWENEEPKLRVSTKTDPVKKDAEERQNQIIFKSQYDAHAKRMKNYKDNLVKAYAIIKSRCSEAMKNKIEARTDYDAIVDNPVNLLKAIREHALNYQENKYDMSVVFESFKTLFNTRQGEDESLHSYTKSFCVAVELLESYLGEPLILPKIIPAMEEYKQNPGNMDVVVKLQRQEFDRFAAAYLYLENADRSKYGSILNGLNTQQSLGNNQFPTTITEANNVLSNHPYDKEYHEKQKKKRNQEKKTKDNEKQRDKENDESENDFPLSFAQLEGGCYCCGKKGHKSPSCREKDSKPKDEWAIIKVQQNFAQTVASESSQQSEQSAPATVSVGSTTSGANGGASNNQAATSNVQQSSLRPGNRSGVARCPAWCNTQIGIEAMLQFFNFADMKDWILLDNESSASIFCNPKFVEGDGQQAGSPLASRNCGGEDAFQIRSKKAACCQGRQNSERCQSDDACENPLPCHQALSAGVIVCIPTQNFDF